jgi:hypothetical protein
MTLHSHCSSGLRGLLEPLGGSYSEPTSGNGEGTSGVERLRRGQSPTNLIDATRHKRPQTEVGHGRARRNIDGDGVGVSHGARSRSTPGDAHTRKLTTRDLRSTRSPGIGRVQRDKSGRGLKSREHDIFSRRRSTSHKWNSLSEKESLLLERFSWVRQQPSLRLGQA